MECVFCKINTGDKQVKIVYQDTMVIAFNDENPKAPIHQLIIPRQHIATLNDLTDQSLAGHMLQTVRYLAQKASIEKSGYRTVINCNSDGGQSVYHLHLHLLGGCPLQTNC